MVYNRAVRADTRQKTSIEQIWGRDDVRQLLETLRKASTALVLERATVVFLSL